VPQIKAFKYLPELRPAGPQFLLISIWLLTRLYHFIGYELFLATDSKDYLAAANALTFGAANESGLGRSFLYVFILKFFSEKLLLLVGIQAILSLYTALLLYKVIDRRVRKKLIPLAFSIAFLVYPLTGYLEGQILTETISACLILKFWESWERNCHNPTTKSSASTLTFALLLTLHRPSFVIFIAAITLPSLVKRFNLTPSILVRMLFPVCVIVLFLTNLFFLGSFKSGNDAVRTGIAMHLVDVFPIDAENSLISKEISLAEVSLKSANPSNRFWAIQKGTENFTSGNTEVPIESIRTELWERTLVLLKQYPLLFMQSVNKSLFSVFFDDAHAFKPGESYKDIPFRISTLLGFGIFNATFLGILLYSGFIFFLAFYRVSSYSRIDVVTLMALPPCLLLHAVTSPIEQIRYSFPLLSIMFVMTASFIQKSSEFKVRASV
jgi:hypothetical protein